MKSMPDMKNTIMKIFPLSILLLLFFSGFSQTNEFKVALLKEKKGAVMVFAGKRHSFTLDIKGDSIKATDQPNYVSVDEMILQVACVPVPGGIDASKLPLEQQREALNGYVDYEMDYFRKELNLDIKDLKKEWLVIQGRQFLLWYFDMPKPTKKTTGDLTQKTARQVYLSGIWFDQVLDLNDALLDSRDLEKAKALLYPIARSLKSHEGELDIEAFAKTLE
jgi:hypothetical protein